MTQVCKPAGCIDAIRVARIDSCSDAPEAGASNGYIVNCMRNITTTSNIEEGDEVILETDCGFKCWQTKQCDELRNYTITFDLLNPDYEFLSVITGQPLINVGGENIGWYQLEGDPCFPWVSVEMFEKVPEESCTADHLYRRLVFPKVRFQIPSYDRENPFRIDQVTGMTSPAQLNQWGDGPYNDSPYDFSALADGIQTQRMEFYDDGITTKLTGTCGFVTVPVQ